MTDKSYDIDELRRGLVVLNAAIGAYGKRVREQERERCLEAVQEARAALTSPPFPTAGRNYATTATCDAIVDRIESLNDEGA